MFGFLNVNKPSGITSHKIISILRKITGIKQIGHAGTLDPLACGVLPVAIGKAAKLIDYLPEDKEYIAEMYLGKKSDTYDIEGEVVRITNEKIRIEKIKPIINQFKGHMYQIPPAYSAVHYKGKRLYELAREGKVPEDISKREIIINKNEILSFDYEQQILRLQIACSKGTYIRSIVNDIGEIIGCGAVMSALTRIKSSGFDIKDSINISENTTLTQVKENIKTPIDILKMEKIEVSNEEYEKIRNGNKFLNKTQKTGRILLVKSNQIISIAESNEKYIQPQKVFI